MSDTEVREDQALENANVSQSDFLKNPSNNVINEKSKEVQKESEKNNASTPSEIKAVKNCPKEGLHENQNNEFIVDKVGKEIPKSENSLERNTESDRPVTEPSFDSGNASNSVSSLVNWSIASKLGVLKLDGINQFCYEELKDSDNQGMRKDNDYKSYFDAMYAKVFEETENNEPYDDIKIILSSGCVDNSIENMVQASSSECKTKECEFLCQFGSRRLVLMPDSRQFWENEEEYAKETTERDERNNADLTYADDKREDQQKKSIGTEMVIEPGTVGDCNTKRKIHSLKIQAVDFNAKHTDPILVVDQNIFRASFDVSFFDIENITCVVGDKLDVHARVSRRNDYGYETHDIHQVFDVPAFVDREKFTACIKNSVLYLQAPIKQSPN